MGAMTTVVIGAGQAGLAMSKCLADRSIDHVVIERGEVANGALGFAASAHAQLAEPVARFWLRGR